MNKLHIPKKEKVKSRENYLKLLSIIAHNVKGPINYMQFITDYSLKNWQSMKNEDFLECATVINESARNISEQIGNMLSWARIQDGSFNPAISSFDVVRSIREETELQKPILKLKEVVLTLNTTISIFIISDENLLKMAFHNLLTNAIKFTKKGGEIKVDLVENANHYQISVSDNGVGMKAEELQLLDDDKSFSKPGTVKEQGSGFGLRIAKELVGLLDGTINIESEFGVGTKVSIILPR